MNDKKIKRLADLVRLRDAGALIFEEFVEEKAKVLGGLEDKSRKWFVPSIILSLCAVAVIFFTSVLLDKTRNRMSSSKHIEAPSSNSGTNVTQAMSNPQEGAETQTAGSSQVAPVTPEAMLRNGNPEICGSDFAVEGLTAIGRRNAWIDIYSKHVPDFENWKQGLLDSLHIKLEHVASDSVDVLNRKVDCSAFLVVTSNDGRYSHGERVSYTIYEDLSNMRVAITNATTGVSTAFGFVARAVAKPDRERAAAAALKACEASGMTMCNFPVN